MKKLLLLLCLSTVSFGFSQTVLEFNENYREYLMRMQTEPLVDSFAFYMNQTSEDSLTLRKIKKFQRNMYVLRDRMSFNSDSTVDYTAYQKAYKSFLESELFCANESETPEWEAIGPIGNIGFQPNGGTMAIAHDQGLVTAVSVNPNDINEIVIGTYGGLFKTTNGGQNWVNVSDELPYPVFGITKILRISSNGQKMIAASGKPFGFFLNSGIGVLYSDDGGDTWSLTSGIVEEEIYPLINDIHYKDGIALALTDENVYISEDDGLNWALHTSIPSSFNPFYYPMQSLMGVDNGSLLVSLEGTNQAVGKYIYFYNGLTESWTDITEDFDMPIPPDPNTNFPFATQQTNFSSRFFYSTTVSEHSDYPTDALKRQVVRTNGWSVSEHPLDNTIDVLHCDFSGVVNNHEVITSRNFSILLSAYPGSDEWENAQIAAKLFLPKGVSFKVCIFPSLLAGSSTITNDQAFYDAYWADYAIYEIPSSNQDQWLDFESLPGELLEANSATGFTHWSFVLEIDPLVYDDGVLYLESIAVNIGQSELSKVSFTHDKICYNTNARVRGLFEWENNVPSYIGNVNSRSAPSPGYQSVVTSEKYSGIYYTGTVGLDFIDLNESLHKVVEGCPHQYGQSQAINEKWHVDVRSMDIIYDAISDKEYIFIGNDGGIVKGEVVGTNQIDFESINGDLAISLCYGLSVNDINGNILVPVQDNCILEYDANEDEWGIRTFGDGIYTYFDEQEDVSLLFLNSGARKYPSSSTLWNSWGENSNSFLGAQIKGYEFNTDRAYTGLKGGAIRRFDRVGSGSDIDISQIDGDIVSLGICENDRDRIYAGTYWNTTPLVKSENGGTSFTSLANSTVATLDNTTKPLSDVVSEFGHFVRDVAVDHNDSDKFWIAVSGIYKVGNGVNIHEREKVLMSSNGGTSFVDYSEGLPNIPVSALIYVTGYNDLLFAGTDAGVYYRDASMSKWECYSNGLPLAVITGLTFNYCSKELYCSTFGRGIFKVKVDAQPDFAGSSRIIETNQTYSGDEYCFQDIRIPSGKTLTVTGTLHMGADRTIHIEPGGKLVVDGGTVTNSCGARWQGIQVYGQSGLHQTSANQGILVTKNDAVIEFANQAVEVWKKDVWNTMGGMLNLESTTFRNNGKSIAFFPYANIIPSGSEIQNYSYISNCSFIVDDEFVGNAPVTQVTLFGVKGVPILNSHFEDERTGIAPADRMSGIRSLDASFKVLGSCPFGQTCTTDYYDETKIVPTTFKNLSFGIHAQNAQTMSQATIDRCYFEDVHKGVVIDAMDNAIVSRNLFNNEVYRATNIITQGATAYKIEGNTFNGTNIEDNIAAVQVYHSGAESNEIFRNRYKTISIGNVSVGLNRDLFWTQTGADNRGLQFLCNTYEANEIDQLVVAVMTPIEGEGIQDWQGTPDVSAGNTYDYTEHKSIINTAENQGAFRYFYFENNANEEPINSAEIEKLFSDNPHECKNSFNQIIVRPTKPILGDKRPGVLNDLDSIIGVIAAKKSVLDSLLRLGDTSLLYAKIPLIKFDNSNDAFIQLSNAAPYLSKGVLYLLADVDPSQFAHEYLRDICILHPEESHHPDFIDYLENKTVPMPTAMIDSILNSPEFSELSAQRAEIRLLHEQKEVLSTLLLQDYFTDSIYPSLTALNTAVTQRGHEMLPLELVQTAIWKQDRSILLQAISDASDWLDTTDFHILTEMVIADYLDFQTDLLNLTSGVYLEGVDSTAEAMLQDYAQNAIGYAKFQAENYLCFFLNECDIPDYEYIKPKGMLNDDTLLEEEWIETINEGNTVSLYPNPATDEATFDFGGEAEKVLFVVFNAQGQLIADGSALDTSTHKISTANWQPGLYLIRVRVNNNKNETLRLIVK